MACLILQDFFRTDRSWSTAPEEAIISSLSTFLSHVTSFMSFPSSAWSDIWYVLETLVFNCFLLCSRAKRWANSSRCWSEVQITDATEWTACLSLILAVSMDFWSKDLLLASFRKEWSVEVPEMSSLPSNSSAALEETCYPKHHSHFFLFSHLQPSFILVVTCFSQFLFSFSFFSSFLFSPAINPLPPCFHWAIKKFQFSWISIIWRAFAWDIEQIWKIWSEKLLYFSSVSLFSCFCLEVYPL